MHGIRLVGGRRRCHVPRLRRPMESAADTRRDAISAGPNYTLDRLHSLGKVLFEGDRSEFEEPDSGNLDLRGITPDPVREKMRELGLRMERDDSHDSNGG